MKQIKFFYILLFIAGLLINGCMFPTVKLFTDASDPLKEYVLEGDETEKVLMIPVYGIISDIPNKGIIFTEPSMVQDIVSQLRLAEADPDIKAVLFKIDSPGGTVTASDILYHEIKSFKERTGIKVTVEIMNVAASGGYYMALPADFIMAHPTSVTGSVGVIFLQPKFYELMDKIGVGVTASTSGKNKDMGSPFRKATDAEAKIFQGLTDSLGKRFVDLVIEHRKIGPDAVENISTARIYLADEALMLGLIDEIGYINEAISRTKELAGLDENSQVVVYRRVEYPDDNLYNTQSRYGALKSPLIDLGLPDISILNRAGFYYLWPSGVDGN
ncbi:MAG: signal peptide peptidase SppA [Desulfobacteraceae bacterium]|nr:signal peptide peptidase SppA [Desulfobacteraceae bacterium]